MPPPHADRSGGPPKNSAESDILDQSNLQATSAGFTSGRVGLYSLRHRLPLLILGFLGVIGATFSWMAYHEVQHALRLNGLERAAAAATHVAELLGDSAAAREAEARRFASDPRVRQAVQAGAVPASFRSSLSRNQDSTVWLYDPKGSVIWPLREPQPSALPPPHDRGSAVPSEGVSPLRLHDGRVSYSVTVTVPGDSEGTLPAGYLSIERSIRSSSGTALIERLIGDGAAIKLGNAEGNIWTDLTAPVPAPPLGGSSASSAHTIDGQIRLGASAPVAGTPWLAWADVSEAAVLEPAWTLWERMVPITLVITLLGGLAVYVVSARVTKPLEQLAHAAQAVASGDYSHRLVIARRDEIGRVALAFNAMAVQIGESHEQLEERVHSRTQELEAFSYSVSHDLRAPLRHIGGFAGLLQQSGSTYFTEQDRRYVGTIADAARRMSRLVDDLLGFSRVGRQEMQRSTVDLDFLVREVIGEHAGDVDARQVEFVVGALPPVRGDRAMLKVVFTNLIGNAVKYTSTRERARIEIGAVPANPASVFFVRDNGVGFDMQYVDKLFGVFQRLHTAEEFEGTGIGLANVSRVVKRHGGRVWAEAEVDRGASFYIHLPE